MSRPSDPEPRFIVDAMLGKLARWLRLLGYDTLYDPKAQDRHLLRIAVQDGRWLLTRDRRLAAASKPGLRTLLVNGDRYRDQLRQVLREIGSGPTKVLCRCIICNVELSEAPPEAALEAVPEFIRSSHRRFKQCPACGRVYWPGSHLEDIGRVLAEEGISLDAPGS